MPEPTTTKPRAVVERPDSVTHFICPETDGDRQGELTPVTHHIVHERCVYCGKTPAALREELGL